MFALGILSIIQLTLLPGLLVLLALRQTGGGLLRTLLLAFPISLLINHILTVTLTFAGLYTQVTLLVVFGVECVLLVWLARRQIAQAPLKVWEDDIRRVSMLGATVREDLANGRVSSLVVLVAALACLAYVAARAWSEIGEVFSAWDAVVSWNRWANDWARGRLPFRTWGYPQLLPTTFATTYVFIGMPEVQVFAKGLMGLFPLAILLAQLDLALRQCERPSACSRDAQRALYGGAEKTLAARRGHTFGYLSAIVFTTVLLDQLLPLFMMSGYADVPTAALAFLAAYALVLVEDAPTRRDAIVGTMIAAACAASAMLTKQAGIQFVAAFPVLAYIALRRNANNPLSIHLSTGHPERYSAKDLASPSMPDPSRPIVLDYSGPRVSVRSGVTLLSITVCAGALMLLLALPWYTLKYIDFKNQKDVSEIAMVAGAHAGRDYFERAAFGWKMVRDAMMPLPAAALAIGMVGLSFYSRTWRPHAILIIVPGLVLWTLLYSYDLRNMTIVLPFLGTASALGLHAVCRMLADKGILAFGALPARARWATIAVVLVGVLLYMNWWVDRHTLFAYQVKKQKQVGYTDLNTVIYQYAAEHPLDRPMLTNYQFVGYLPELTKVYRYETFRDLTQLREHMQKEQPGFLLFAEVGPFVPTADVAAYIDAQVSAGSFEIARRWQGWRMIRIKNLSPTTAATVAHP